MSEDFKVEIVNTEKSFLVKEDVNEVVVPANYNCPGQLVISGTNKGIDIACEKLIEAGA